MTSAETALLFPGQGAQAPQMLTGFARAPRFAERLGVVSAVLGENPLPRVEGGDLEYLEQNRVSSLLTVLASRLALDLYAARPAAAPPAALAGYSVGQWTALHAAGVIGFAELMTVVERRAPRMDECVARAPGGMIGVIGLRFSEVEETCAGLRARGLSAWVANYNCVGQCSVAGEPEALSAALAELADRRAKKLVRLPVAGAWHSELLRGAAAPFREFLEGIDLRPPEVPVIDNVTGRYLPEDRARLRDQLARHLHRPIRWDRGIRRLVESGCAELVEIGYGNMLTKFGFFIDRAVRHRAFATDPTVARDPLRSGR